MPGSGRNLPYHDLALYAGLSTNLRADEIAGKYLILAQNVDTYERFKCLGKTVGSTKVADSHGATVRSLHQFEYFGLDGILDRQQLSFAADGVLRKINSNGTLTSLQSSLKDGILRSVKASNKLFLTSPEQRTLSTGGIKYDGTRTTNWGCLAPGQIETVHLSFNSSADFTASTDGAISNSTTSIDGGGSVQLNKTGTSAALVYVEEQSVSLNFSALGQSTLFIYVFLPYGVLQKLATSGTAVAVSYGNSAFTATDSHNFSVGELVPGWNLLSMVTSAPDSQAGGGATLTTIERVRVTLNTINSSQTFTGVLVDKLFSQANGTITTAEGAAGNLTGTYRYRCSFVTEYGLESNGGPASSSRTVTSKKIELSTIPVSTDTQVVARRIYRDISGDGIWRFVDQVDDNVTTTFSDNIADTSLGAATLPLAADTVFDNSPPGRFHSMALYQSRIVGIDADDRNRLIIGEAGEPEAFRLIDELVLDESLEAVELHPFGLLIYATDSTFLLSGDGVQIPFRIERLTDQLGVNGFRSFCIVKNIHMAMREAEVFLIANPSDPWFLNKHVLDHFRDDITASTRADTFAVHDRARLRVIFFSKGSGGDYDQIDVWQYGTAAYEEISGDGAGVDPQDVRVGGWFSLALPSSINPHCAAIMERTADQSELWIGGEDGYVYWLGDPSKTSWAEGASTAAIDAQFETAAVPLGSDIGGRGEPRFLSIEAQCSAETTWTVTVTLLTDADGDEIGTKQFTVTLPNGNSSPLVPIPSIGKRGEWARVKMAQATSAGVGIIKSLRLYYIPRGDFRGPRTA